MSGLPMRWSSIVTSSWGIALNDLNDQLEKYALHNSSTMRTLSFEQKLYMDECKGAYEMQVTAITEVLCTHRDQAGT